MAVTFDSNVSITVEIAFDSNPLDSSQSFTDVSQFLRSFTTNRGRNSNLDKFQTGTATVVLDNRDNRFSPNQTTHFFDSSTGITKIQPLKRLRIRATHSSTTYDIFHGFVESFPVNYAGQGSDSTTRIKVVDAFKLFFNAKLDGIGWNLGISLLGSTTRLTLTQAQELSSIRVKNILDSFGYSNQAISTGQLQVTTQSTTDDLLTALRKVETAENGTFFIAANGDATFRDRNFRLTNTTTPSATFGQGGSDLPYSDIKTSYDDNKIINTVQRTRTGSSNTQIAIDSDSINRFGTHVLTENNTLNIQDSDVASIAEQKVISNSIPQTVVEQLSFRPQQDSNLWVKALGLDIGSFVEAKVTTPSSSIETYDLFIERISHKVDARNKTWNWVIGLSPAETGAWILGVSKLGIDTNISYT
tara:strand:+ start:2038 stop:3285 length:1248 start_codon:yes stop_codon:yes gene_type:complete